MESIAIILGRFAGVYAGGVGNYEDWAFFVCMRMANNIHRLN
jgi:hypothetical protein